MSRIGKLPIKIPAGVTINSANSEVTVKGPKGTLKQAIENKYINVNVAGDTLTVTRTDDAKENRAAHGLYRALIANMVVGVTNGYKKEIVLNGVGYRAEQSGTSVIIKAGYSHPTTITAPAGIKLTAINDPKVPEVHVEGIDKTLVGQVAANIKSIRIPDPYHAYGLKYKDEKIARKQAKKTGKK